MHKIGIIQPNYIPWRGYFDFIHEVDVFVFFDDVQYTTQDWRNRNRIKTKNGESTWLSVPVLGGRNQLIKDVKIDNSQAWLRKHLNSIQQNYQGTPYFDEYFDSISKVYNEGFEFLSELDVALTECLCRSLGINTEFVLSSELGFEGVKDDKLLKIVHHLEGDYYLSGPAAKAYMRDDLWESAGVEVAYKDYSGYPEYPQISEPFEPAVSMLDLLFMVGNEAPDYIWGKHRL